MRRRVAVVAAFVACVALAGAFAVGPVAGQSGTDADGAIDACTVVDEPGTYDLDGDVQANGSASCIEIQSSDVVLDGNGYAVEGPSPSADDADGSSTAGILVDGDATESYENVTVEDVTVSGFDAGVQAGTAGSGDDTEVAVVDVTVADAGRGVLLRGGNATLSAVTVEDSDGGVYADGTGAVEAFDLDLRNNGYGISAAETGPFYVETSTVENNDGNGVEVGPGVSMDTYAVDVTNNGGVGVTATGQDTSVTTSDGAVSENDEAGVRLDDGAVGELSDTDVSGNGGDGVRTSEDAEVMLYGVTASDNDGWELDARDGNAYARNLQVAQSTTVSFNSGPVALEPVARADLPAPPENTTFVADGLNVSDNGMAVGMTFDLDDDVDADAVEVWRHDGAEWLLEGEAAAENGTVEKYNAAEGIFAPAVAGSNATAPNDGEGTPTATPTPTESSGSADDSPDVDVDPGSISTSEETATPTPNGTAASDGTTNSTTSNGTATATSTSTATASETNESDGATGADEVQGDQAADEAENEESGFALADGAGFGVAVAVLALLAGTLLAHRRR